MNQIEFGGLQVARSPLYSPSDLFGIGYGLYIVTCRENGKDNGLVVNTVSQIGLNPDLIAVSLNRANFSTEVIRRTGRMNVSILTESAPFSLFERFGFQSGRKTDKKAFHCGCRGRRYLDPFDYLRDPRVGKKKEEKRYWSQR